MRCASRVATDAQLEAQAGYIYAERKEYKLAKTAFRRACRDRRPEDIRLQSLQAIGNLDGEARRVARSASISTPNTFDRFDDGIVDAGLHFNQRLGRDSPFSVYLNARLLRDTASQVGPLPQIFDDNAFLGGFGILFQPGAGHLAFSAEANEAYVFYAGRNHTAATVPDLRAVVGYYNVFRPTAESRFSLQANGSVGFYSRYQHDGILYLQPQQGYDLNRSGPVRLTPYLQENIALDTKQQYYNNIAEVIPGLQLEFPRAADLAFHFEYVRGYYLPFHTNTVNPYGTAYNDFRVRLTWSKAIPLGKGSE